MRLVDQWLDAQVAFGRMPGAAAGIVVDQDLVWSRGFGWADVERRTAATPDTLYGICSISKLFTAVAVMLERDAGRLRLDDPVASHLAYFRLEESAPGSPPVTIRDLLTHFGGIPRESPHPYWTGSEFAFPSREEIVAGLARQRMLYPAERYFQYSNLGMSLLGQVVEVTSGLPYESMGVSPEAMAERALQVIRPALEGGTTSEKEREVATADLEKFAGLYTSAWGETVIVPWQDGLAALDVPTDDPAGDLARLSHVGGNTFRRIRDDGDDLGEEVVFEADAGGRVTRFLWHQNYSVKVR